MKAVISSDMVLELDGNQVLMHQYDKNYPKDNKVTLLTIPQVQKLRIALEAFERKMNE